MRVPDDARRPARAGLSVSVQAPAPRVPRMVYEEGRIAPRPDHNCPVATTVAQDLVRYRALVRVSFGNVISELSVDAAAEGLNVAFDGE